MTNPTPENYADVRPAGQSSGWFVDTSEVSVTFNEKGTAAQCSLWVKSTRLGQHIVKVVAHGDTLYGAINVTEVDTWLRYETVLHVAP